jgi:RNA polymerase sigma-70 factor, ECF subfamily
MHTELFGLDDTDLVGEVMAGSHDALAVLYDRHVEAIYSMTRRLTRDRHVAEEVVQETFLALWNQAELFDPHVGSLPAWLRAIARNRTIDRLRAAGRRPTLVTLRGAARDDEPDDVALDRLAGSGAPIGGSEPPPDPEAAAVEAWTRRRIGQALAELPEEERTVIVMAYDDELSQSEIAERLGWPIGTVKTRTRRALRRLREMVGPELERAPDAIEGSVAASGASDGSR